MPQGQRDEKKGDRETETNFTRTCEANDECDGSGPDEDEGGVQGNVGQPKQRRYS